MQAHEVKEYYRQITSVDIGAVARALFGDRITEERGAVIHVDCPVHHSVSGTSLHIELDTQLWRCWGCGISGDVLQLVEFARHGVVTTGVAGVMTESHRDARDWLAEQAGLPKLSHIGLSEVEISALERREVTLQRAQAVLTTAAAWYHDRLMENDAMKAWVQTQYAFNDEMLVTYGIGFADLQGLRDHLYGQGYSMEELLASGLFRPNDSGEESKVLPFFNQRVMFPYWSRGRVTYFIGRKCPLTPDDKWESGKYKKLLTHDPEKRPWVAEGIENNQLFNEDCLLARPRQVIITEGITDCLAVMARGFPCISPVTVNIRHDDWARIIPKLQRVKEVVVCQDNELSHAGWKGALSTARQLEAAGIACRIAELPLDDAQRQARAELAERFGIRESLGAQALAGRLADRSPDEQAAAHRLLNAAKMDLCGFFVAEHTADEFQEIIRTARTALEVAIDALVPEMAPPDREDAVTAILRQIAQRPALEHTPYLKSLRHRLGKEQISMTDLRTALKEAQRDVRDAKRAHAQQSGADGLTPVHTDGRRSFYLEDNGIVRERSRETAQGTMVTRETISNFHIVIQRERIVDDGMVRPDGSTTLTKLLIGEIVGKDWTTPICIDAEHWASNGKLASAISAVTGTRALFATTDLDEVRIVSGQLSGTPSTETIYAFFGYHPTAGFVTPTVTIQHGAIVPSAELDIAIDPGAEYDKARNLNLQQGSDDEVREVLGHLFSDYLNVAPADVTMPILAHAFLGPMLFGSPLTDQGFTPFTLFVAGSSGKGKTETARLAQCLYGHFGTKERIAAWGSTPESNRQEAARCHGALWVIDDFKRHRLQQQYGNAVRMLNDYADMQGRKRATPGAKIITSHPAKCMLMVTGEDLPYSEPSVLARCLIVDFRTTDTSRDHYYNCLAQCHRYQIVPTAFIAWWQRQDHAYWVKRGFTLRGEFLEYLKCKNLDGDNAIRLASSAALSLLSMEAIRDFAYQLGLDPQALAGCDLAQEYAGVLRDVLRHMTTLVNEVRPAEIFLQTLMELIASGTVRILDPYQESMDDPHPAKIIGHYRLDEGAVHLYITMATGAVRDAYRRGEERNLNWETTTIGKQLAEDGYLLAEDLNEKNYQRKVRLPGAGAAQHPVRVWRIAADKFTTLLKRYRDGMRTPMA